MGMGRGEDHLLHIFNLGLSSVHADGGKAMAATTLDDLAGLFEEMHAGMARMRETWRP
jgi:hypothetical protein